CQEKRCVLHLVSLLFQSEKHCFRKILFYAEGVVEKPIILNYNSRHMKSRKKSHITIVGTGLAGCYLSVLLAKRGYQVTIYERMSRKEVLEPSKRSINISFHNYGADALREVGVWEQVKAD